MDSIIGKQLEKNITNAFSSGDIPKFGVGNPVHEKQNCSEIVAFVACFGVAGLTVEKRRMILPATLPIGDIKEQYINRSDKSNIPQDAICDENFFRIDKMELQRPLHSFSNQCKLNVSLIYSDHVTMPLMHGLNTLGNGITSMTKPL